MLFTIQIYKNPWRQPWQLLVYSIPWKELRVKVRMRRSVLQEDWQNRSLHRVFSRVFFFLMNLNPWVFPCQKTLLPLTKLSVPHD